MVTVKKSTRLAMILMLSIALSGEMPAKQPNDASPTISLDVTDAYLPDVLKLLSQQSGLSFVASDEVSDKKVTLYLNQVPLEAALETILQANHLAVQEKGAGRKLYVITYSGTPKFNTITKVFRLKFARVLPSAGEILTTFGLSGSLVVQTLGSSSSSGGSSGSGSSGSSSYGGSSSGGSSSGGLGSVTGTGTTQTNAGLMAILRSLLTEHGSVVADPRTNSVIITDIPERFPTIEETLAKLDVQPTQIYLEAEVLEVNLETLRRLGLEFGDSTGTIGHYVLPIKASKFPFSGGLSLLNPATSAGSLSFADASILFKMLASEQDVKFLARPRLVTLSNEVAEIRIVSEPVTGVTSTSQTQTGSITSTPERTTVGTILRITPLVNDGRYITMVIEPEVSKVSQSSTFSSFLDPSRRLARTTVMVPNGGTAMVAGLISSENTLTSRRIPGIGDLPIIGIPFKRSTTQRTNTEILIFITPRIMTETPMEQVVLQQREQTSLSRDEKRFVEDHNQKFLKERAISETIEGILR